MREQSPSCEKRKVRPHVSPAYDLEALDELRVVDWDMQPIEDSSELFLLKLPNGNVLDVRFRQRVQGLYGVCQRPSEENVLLAIAQLKAVIDGES